MSRRERIMSGAALWCSYYRANPHRFANDYLHVELHLFQKILLVMMNISTVFVFIASRGIGKTYLSALFCVIRCILWPGTKICIASGTRGQAGVVLEKIMLELKQGSVELAAEIDEKQSKTNGTDAKIVFKNGSYIKVVTAADSARGNRANILLLDEFRLISKDVIDLILKKFLTQKRRPKYTALTKEERKAERAKEKNMTMYLSSAYMVSHWSYRKCKDVCLAMLDDRRNQFVCGLPYQLPVSEGLITEEAILEELSETDFSELKFQMEYEALWWGNADGTFFDFNSIAKNRKIKYPMLPDSLANKLPNNTKVRIPTKINGEQRILSADIALMASTAKRKNDATAIFINQLMPTKAGRYTSNIVYCAATEGMHTEDQALMIRKLYDEFMCDYIVLDANGVGLGVYDCLVRDMSDPETGEIYPALSCCNDPAMEERCAVAGADKVIWSIKATPKLNSDCAVLLREGFRSGKIRLLVSEYDAEVSFKEVGGFDKLSEYEKSQFLLPCVHTNLLIDELVKLQHEEGQNGMVKIFERAGNRKDRYSSLSYNYYVATQLESKLSRRQSAEFDMSDIFVIKPPILRKSRRR